MDNLELYKNLTEKQDWAGIISLNNIIMDMSAVKKELSVLGSHLEKDEVVLFIINGILSQVKINNVLEFGTNNWICVLTNERILCLHHAIGRKAVDIQIILYEKIQSISSSHGWFFGKINIDIGSRTVVLDNAPKHHVLIFASLVNKFLREMRTIKQLDSNKDKNIVSDLEKLVNLRKNGEITDLEFNIMKNKLIKIN